MSGIFFLNPLLSISADADVSVDDGSLDTIQTN